MGRATGIRINKNAAYSKLHDCCQYARRKSWLLLFW